MDKMTPEQSRAFKNSPIENVIAETKITCIDKDGTRKEVHIQIGRPYTEEDQVAGCPVALYGLGGRMRDMHASDTLSALCYAIRMAKFTFDEYVKYGGKIYYTADDDDEEIDSGEISVELLFPIFQPDAPRGYQGRPPYVFFGE